MVAMKHYLCRSSLLLILPLLWLCLGRGASSAAEPPPEGFTLLFNNQDLAGWWGEETKDPRGYMALSPEAFRQKHDKSLEDIRKHWRVETGELINDGEGLYLT